MARAWPILLSVACSMWFGPAAGQTQWSCSAADTARCRGADRADEAQRLREAQQRRQQELEEQRRLQAQRMREQEERRRLEEDRRRAEEQRRLESQRAAMEAEAQRRREAQQRMLYETNARINALNNQSAAVQNAVGEAGNTLLRQMEERNRREEQARARDAMSEAQREAREAEREARRLEQQRESYSRSYEQAGRQATYGSPDVSALPSQTSTAPSALTAPYSPPQPTLADQLGSAARQWDSTSSGNTALELRNAAETFSGSRETPSTWADELRAAGRSFGSEVSHAASATREVAQSLFARLSEQVATGEDVSATRAAAAVAETSLTDRLSETWKNLINSLWLRGDLTPEQKQQAEADLNYNRAARELVAPDRKRPLEFFDRYVAQPMEESASGNR